MFHYNSFQRKHSGRRPYGGKSRQRRRLYLQLLEDRRVLAAVPYGAEPISTNEYMLGDVYVSVVLLESNGTIDPVVANWTPEMIDAEKDKVTQAMAWWENMLELQESNHYLNFEIDFSFADEPFLTSYEPSSRPREEMHLWTQEFLSGQGFDRHENWIGNLRDFNHSRRIENDTHWAFTYFIINVTGNEGWNNGRAHGSLNGWGLQSNLRTAAVLAHEVGHVFYAMDEYPNSSSYFNHRGYYNTQNLNAYDDHPDSDSRVVSIMDRSWVGFANNVASPSALASIGWQDSSGNGIFDLLDVPLVLEGVGAFDTETNTYQFSGESWVQTLPNLNPSGPGNDITINTVSRIQYRLDGGDWIDVASPGGYRTQFDVAIGPLTGIDHAIEIRTIADESGVTSNYFVGDTRFPAGIGGPGISGFAWFDANDNAQWDAYETGLEHIKIVVRDVDDQVASRTFVMEPDDFKHRQWINEIHPDVDLTAIGGEVDGRVHAFDSIGSTGQRVFAHRLLNNNWNTTWNVNRQLRADFKNPVQRVSIDVISPFNGAEARMEAYSADGQLLGSTDTGRLNSGESETLAISISEAAIDHVVIAGIPRRSSFRLDNLLFSVDAIAFTDQFGFYSVENLEPGVYAVSAEHPLEATPVAPAGNQYTIDLASGQRRGEVHFGFNEESGPWQPVPTTPNLGGIQVEFRGGRGQTIEAPHYGERIHLRVSWEERAIATDEQYVVRTWVNDIPLDSEVFTGSGNATTNRSTVFEGWYAGPGTSTIRVELDPVGNVTESDLGDNLLTREFATGAPITLPEKLAWPVAGLHNQHWAINNYLDVDPRHELRRDFGGGNFQYDGHQGIDIGLRYFFAMDAGIPISAATGGAVTIVRDGNFDRETTGGPASNYVRIEHGTGWRTIYSHFARDSITVSEGDFVHAGQVLGLMGSSGGSTAAHLHFGLYHENASIEPFFAPESYWDDPLPYQPDTRHKVLFQAVTDYSVRHGDTRERIAGVASFPSDFDGVVYYYYRLSHVSPGDEIYIELIQPNGIIASTRQRNFDEGFNSGLYANSFVRNWGAHTGEWGIVLYSNGEELGRSTFTIGEQPTPTIRLSQNDTYIIDGRTTPIDFREVSNANNKRVRFNVENYGYAELSISQIEVPKGFVLTSLPTDVSRGEETTFSIEINSSRFGYRIGEVRLHTNDPKSPLFTFVVEGEVAGQVPTNTPEITLPGHALYYELGTASKSIADDSDISTIAPGNGVLKVQLVAGGKPGDQIVLKSQWGDPQRIATNGEDVFFQGQRIARFTAGFDNVPAVIEFEPQASSAAVQATIRAISYRNGRGADGQSIRRVGYTFTDGQGRESLPAYRAIVTSQNDSILLGNARPTDIELAVADFDPAQAGAVIGQLHVTDPDDDQHVVTVSDQRFEVVDGVLRLRVGEQLEQDLETVVEVEITATDPGHLSLTKTFTIPVRFNQAPVFDIADPFLVTETLLESVAFDNAVTAIAPAAMSGLADELRQTVQFSITPVSVPAGLMTEFPEMTPDSFAAPWPASASLAVFPAPHAFGMAVYEITATDDDPLDPRSTSQLLTVTIDPVNDPPVAFERMLTVREAVEADDETAVLEFTAADLITGGLGETPNRPADLPPSVPPPFDESEQTLRVVAFVVPGQPAVDAADLPGGSGTVKRTLPSSGKIRFLFADGEFVSGIYTPPVDFNEHPVFGGPDTFRYIIEDDGKTTIPGGDGVPVFLPPERSQPATVTLRVLPANDPPQFTPGDELLIGHDRAAYAATWATDVLPGPPTALDELAEQTVEFELTIPEPGRDLFTANGLPTLGGDGVLRFTAAPLAHGQVVIDVVAVDSLGARSQPVELTITLADILDPPLVSDDRVGTYRGDPLEIDLLAGAQATTAEIDSESIEIVIEPVAGELLILGGGRVRYVAAANAAGEDHFSYRISDIEGRVSESATVTILLATSPLQNPLRYGDVNADGNLTPLDALLILNRLAQAQREGISGGVPVQMLVDESPRFFYDTDGNGRIEPLDALLVLNQIARNNRQNRAEGLVFAPAWESAMQLTPSTPIDEKTIGHPLDSPAKSNTAEPSVDWNVATIDQVFERLDYSDEESRQDQASDQLDLWVGLLSTEPRTIIPA